MGGGYGALLKQIGAVFPEVPVLHPYSLSEDSTLRRTYLEPFDQIQLVFEPEPPYDLVYSLEVLGHLIDPTSEVWRPN